MRTYHLFISHSWTYTDHYKNLVNLLNQARSFGYRNLSIPKDDPVHSSTGKELSSAIRNKMESCGVVIVLAGVYVGYSKWIDKEIKIARSGFSKPKPILVIEPWASKRTSKMSPREAVEYFQDKSYAVSENWWSIWLEANARAFTVAKATKLSVLAEIRGALAEASVEGTTEREFVKALKPRLQKLGWWGRRADGQMLGSSRRLETIFRTNMASFYNARRWREQARRAMASVGARPYLQYVAVHDLSTRPSHAALHGKVFPHDSKFWDAWYPPNGFNCRCRVRALTEDQVRRRKLKVEKDFELPEIQRQVGIDRATGKVIRRPVRGFRGRDAAGKPITITLPPGFDYNPGKGARNNADKIVEWNTDSIVSAIKELA